jgi:hypothetical protein
LRAAPEGWKSAIQQIGNLRYASQGSTESHPTVEEMSNLRAASPAL